MLKTIFHFFRYTYCTGETYPYICRVNKKQRTTMKAIHTQLNALAAKYKAVGLSHREFSAMVRKAAILASAIGMPSGELLDMVIANN